jgi:hypothetical protein
VPKYLPDAAVASCPATKRTGKASQPPRPVDHKTESSYVYEFSDAEVIGHSQAGKMKMRELRSLQMAVVGGDIPILRCLAHEPTLDIGFDGRFF